MSSLVLEEILYAINNSRHSYELDINAVLPKEVTNIKGKIIHGKKILHYVGMIGRNHAWVIRCHHCGKCSIVQHKFLLRASDSEKCKLCLNAKHFDSTTNFYRIWYRLVAKCTKESHKDYATNGKLGFTVCDRWLDYDKFKVDMFGTYIKGTVIKLNKGKMEYNKKNCRWLDRTYNFNSATAKELKTKKEKTNSKTWW